MLIQHKLVYGLPPSYRSKRTGRIDGVAVLVEPPDAAQLVEVGRPREELRRTPRLLDVVPSTPTAPGA